MITLRRATEADIPLLYRWDEAPHVRDGVPGTYCDWEQELALPDWQENLIAEHDGRPIGFIRIIDPAREESRYWGEQPPGLRALDIWIGEADALGSGHGTEMMRQAIARCFEDPSVDAILIDPFSQNVRAHRFYERLGFEFVEERVFPGDDHPCRVYRLDRARTGVSAPA